MLCREYFNSSGLRATGVKKCCEDLIHYLNPSLLICDHTHRRGHKHSDLQAMQTPLKIEYTKVMMLRRWQAKRVQSQDI